MDAVSESESSVLHVQGIGREVNHTNLNFIFQIETLSCLAQVRIKFTVLKNYFSVLGGGEKRRLKK